MFGHFNFRGKNPWREQTAPQELGKVLSIKLYAEVTKRNRDINQLESLKTIKSATERYL